MPTIAVTGTRSTGHLDLPGLLALFSEYLGPLAGPQVYLGGAAGVDTLALRWLAEHTVARLVVVVPATLADQPPEARAGVAEVRAAGRLGELVEVRHPQWPHHRAPGYRARNRWMVDRAEMVAGFPRAGAEEDASGTWYTLRYAADRGLPRLIIPV